MTEMLLQKHWENSLITDNFIGHKLSVSSLGLYSHVFFLYWKKNIYNYSDTFQMNTANLQTVSCFGLKRFRRFPSANLIIEHWSGPTLTQQELREFWPLRYRLTSTRINKPCMVLRGGGWGTPVSQPAVWNIKGAISEVTRAQQWKLHDVSGAPGICPHPGLDKTH